jgi:hypothetical protein
MYIDRLIEGFDLNISLFLVKKGAKFGLHRLSYLSLPLLFSME